MVQSHLRSGAAAEAESEFRILVRFHPADRDAWQQWYQQQKRVEAEKLN
jgi:hypothetical protein